MADSGPASFWTRANAILRKNLTYQVRHFHFPLVIPLLHVNMRPCTIFVTCKFSVVLGTLGISFYVLSSLVVFFFAETEYMEQCSTYYDSFLPLHSSCVYSSFV